MLPERYMDYISTIRRYSPRTCAIYRDCLEGFYGYVYQDAPFGKCLRDLEDAQALDALRPDLIRGYESHLLQKGLKARTVNLHVSVLSGYCRFLIKEGLLATNPARLLPRPKMEKRLPDFFRLSDMERYFKETDIFAGELPDLDEAGYRRRLSRAIVSTLYSTGIRRAELISLRRGDIDFRRHIMRVRGKGDKIREIPLTVTFCKEISLYLQSVDTMVGNASTTVSPLFVTWKGKALYPGYVDKTVKEELGNIGKIKGKISPHVLRHTVATELLDDGADLNSIKAFLGHSSLAATQVYTHNSIEKLKTVYESAHPRAKNGGKYGD